MGTRGRGTAATEASWGIDHLRAPAYLLSHSVLAGRGKGGNMDKWVSQSPTALHAAPFNKGMWSVERDPLRAKNSAEAAGNGFLRGAQIWPPATFPGLGWGNWPSGLDPPDSSLPDEVCHPVCLPLPSLRPAQGS